MFNHYQVCFLDQKRFIIKKWNGVLVNMTKILLYHFNYLFLLVRVAPAADVVAGPESVEVDVAVGDAEAAGERSKI